MVKGHLEGDGLIITRDINQDARRCQGSCDFAIDVVNDEVCQGALVFIPEALECVVNVGLGQRNDLIVWLRGRRPPRRLATSAGNDGSE